MEDQPIAAVTSIREACGRVSNAFQKKIRNVPTFRNMSPARSPDKRLIGP
jgi:hypothetical protein